MQIPGKGAPTTIAADEGPRKDTSVETLAKLKPVFRKDRGTVTAGNAPGLNDGASALVVSSLAFAKANGITPLARVTGYATGGGEPREIFFAPVQAVRNLMGRAGTTIGDYDLIEANEAFAVQALADGARAGLGLGPGERARRRGRAWPSDRRERRPRAHDPALCPARPGRRDRPRHPVPGRRQRGGAQRGDALMNDGRHAGALATADRWLAGRRAFAVGVAALVVAASAQVTVPVPLSPVPMTLQPLAVIAVGGLLGAALGGSALLLYLCLGLLGLPVFRRRQRRTPARARADRRLLAGLSSGRRGGGPSRG